MTDLYLIRKSGAYYRPNSQGYTTNIAEAGRYTLADAEAITHPNGPDGPRDHMSYEPAPVPSPEHPLRDRGEGIKAWPLFGYAPGRYLCQCVVCGQQFEGDKRAVNCLECAAKAANQIASLPPARVEEGPRGDGTDTAELVARLRAQSEVTIDNNLDYIQGADALMTEAAGRLTALEREMGEAEAQRDEAKEERANEAEALISKLRASQAEVERLKAELAEAQKLNNKYAWERDKAREERDTAERRSEAYWGGKTKP